MIAGRHGDEPVSMRVPFQLRSSIGIISAQRGEW